MSRVPFLLLFAAYIICLHEKFDRESFVDIQRFIFNDSKYFPDSNRNSTPKNKNDTKELKEKLEAFKSEYRKNTLVNSTGSSDIWQSYKFSAEKDSKAYEDLLAYFKKYFNTYYITPEKTYKTIYKKNAKHLRKVAGISVKPIEASSLKPLWERLIRVLFLLLKESNDKPQHNTNDTISTFIMLENNRFSTPSVRFREQYYWDSYFQMVGFLAIGEIDEAKNMIQNFIRLIDLYGFIPNANRTYYLNRSQPPLFGLMVKEFLQSTKLGKGYDGQFLEELKKSLETELNYWERKSEHAIEISVNKEHFVVHRYYTDETSPRLEGFKEDLNICIKTLKETHHGLNGDILEKLCLYYTKENIGKILIDNQEKYLEKVRSIYSQIAASCESGLDFSSKHFPNDYDESKLNKDLNNELGNLVTHQMAPVELQVYIIILMETIVSVNQKLNELHKEDKDLETLINKKNRKISSFVKVFYNEDKQLYFDRFWKVSDEYKPEGSDGEGTRIYGINQITPTLIDWESYKKTKTNDMIGHEIDHRSNLEKFHKIYKLEESKWLVKTSHYESKLNWDNNYWPPVIYLHFKALIKHKLNVEAHKLKNSYIFNFVNISNYINNHNQDKSDPNFIDYMAEKMMGIEKPENYIDSKDKTNRIYNKDFQKGLKYFDLDKPYINTKEGEYTRQISGGFGWTVGTIISILNVDTNKLAMISTIQQRNNPTLVWRLAIAIIVIGVVVVLVVVYIKYYKKFRFDRNRVNRKQRNSQ